MIRICWVLLLTGCFVETHGSVGAPLRQLAPTTRTLPQGGISVGAGGSSQKQWGAFLIGLSSSPLGRTSGLEAPTVPLMSFGVRYEGVVAESHPNVRPFIRASIDANACPDV